MSIQKSNQAEPMRFHVSRNVGKQDRKHFEDLRGVGEHARARGDILKTHAGMVSIDLMGPDETVAVQKRHPEFTADRVAAVLKEANRKERFRLIGDYVTIEFVPTVELFDTYGGNVAFGLRLAPESAEMMKANRDMLGEVVSLAVGSSVHLPDQESFLTIGRAFGVDDLALEEYADAAERAIWPQGTDDASALTEVFLFDTEPNHVKVYAPSDLPQPHRY